MRPMLFWSAAMVSALWLAVPADAIQFDNYVPATHNRYAGGIDNPTFLLAGYDTSAVAKRDNAGSGAALFTNQHFVTAHHFKPGANVTFRGTDGMDRSFAVSGYQRLTTGGIGSDISIGTLATPVDPGTDFITPLPIAVGSLDGFVGREAYTFGRFDRAGRNVIEQTDLYAFDDDPIDSPTFGFASIFQTTENSGGDGPGPLTDGLGPDEAGLQGGDSGNAALILLDGQLAILGSHFGIGSGFEPPAPDEAPNPDRFTQFDPYFSVSTLLSPYLDQIDTIVARDEQAYTLLAVPEPTALLVMLAGGMLLVGRRCRCRDMGTGTR